MLDSYTLCGKKVTLGLLLGSELLLHTVGYLEIIECDEVHVCWNTRRLNRVGHQTRTFSVSNIIAIIAKKVVFWKNIYIKVRVVTSTHNRVR